MVGQKMTEKIRRKVPHGSPIFPDRPPLSPEEKARRHAEREAFSKRCQVIFDRVYPELVKEHYNWAIIIEPESGEYFIDLDPEVAFQKAKQKYPTAIMLEMRLTETGTCGRI
jgi:hypothetical protein